MDDAEPSGAPDGLDAQTLTALRVRPKAAKRAGARWEKLGAARACEWRGRPALAFTTRSGYLYIIDDGGIGKQWYGYVTLVATVRDARQIYLDFDGKRQVIEFDSEDAAAEWLTLVEATRDGIAAARERDAPLVVSENARLVRDCSYVAGVGLPLRPESRLDLLFDDDGIAFLPSPAKSGTEPLHNLPYSELEELRFEGPGKVTSGGGFIGGGFGLGGAAEGMAVAALLNALTRRTTVETVIAMAGPGWEAFFLHSVSPPDELRRFLSPVHVRLKGDAVERNQGDLLGQLERLASLRERGALTEAEFAEAKRKILGPDSRGPA